jgi:hypothetical protein
MNTHVSAINRHPQEDINAKAYKINTCTVKNTQIMAVINTKCGQYWCDYLFTFNILFLALYI